MLTRLAKFFIRCKLEFSSGHCSDSGGSYGHCDESGSKSNGGCGHCS